jgi:hypothetical protein
MNVVSREVCIGFGLWQPVPKPRGIAGNDAKRGALWAQAQIDMARRAAGEPVSLRTTTIDKSGVCRSSVTRY